MHYNPSEFEEKWRKNWEDTGLYKVVDDDQRQKYYVLDMFPYPSGAGLHVGHPLGYIASDIFSRWKRMQGFNVLHPMGFDAFGLPAEEYAIKTGVHPMVSTTENMKVYRRQFDKIGFSYDWSRSVFTCDPNYYKWTQWIFIQLFESYYDRDKDSAVPISDLIELIKADRHPDLASKAWDAMIPKEQSEYLMGYRLAFRNVGYVNWCEALGTVLANDQVKDGVSERGGHPVVKKPMTQWSLRITEYAERLLQGISTVDWSDSLKAIQRNWIGKSVGAQVFFGIEGSMEKIEVFTTRPDTLFGVRFMVLAPEHDLVASLTSAEQKEEVEVYQKMAKSKSEIERMAQKKVTGAFIGAYTIHPFTEEKLPIYIAEYVLKDYGTGAIMAVPSNDKRDLAFAKKMHIEVVPVVDQSEFPDADVQDKVGTMINSEWLNGLSVKEAIQTAYTRIEEEQLGTRQTNYKMRDANFSRQRYWGEPFPIFFDENDVAQVVPLDELPVNLPDTTDFKPPGNGQSPLTKITDWVNYNSGQRETDVMPAVAGSSWYYLRYMDPNNSERFASKEAVDYWQDVDLYVGGAEHAVAHLLYARFWHKFLYDLGYVPTKEPFKKLINQGMIQGVIEFIFLDKNSDSPKKFYSADAVEDPEDDRWAKMPVHVDFVQDYGTEDSYLDNEGLKKFLDWTSGFESAVFCNKEGEWSAKNAVDDFRVRTLSEVGKMSKSLYNVINPDSVIDKYGTDCFRMYEMFLGPIEQSKPWDTQGIDGVFKFLRKFWNLFFDGDELKTLSQDKPSAEEYKVLHECIKKVNEDIEKFSFNTSVSAFMICTNKLQKLDTSSAEILKPMLVILAPFAPHIAEELWSKSGFSGSVHKQDYPTHDESHLVESSVVYPLCINGKKRDEMSIAADADKDAIEKAALAHEGLQKWIDGKTIRKVIVVPGRMVNVVV